LTKQKGQLCSSLRPGEPVWKADHYDENNQAFGWEITTKNSSYCLFETGHDQFHHAQSQTQK